jgi:4-aminobutyrate aminotransferase-like enzyme
MAANTIRIEPLFCITKADTDFIVKTLDEAFTVIEKG